MYLKRLFKLERNTILKLTPETPTAAQIVICNFPAVLQTYFWVSPNVFFWEIRFMPLQVLRPYHSKGISVAALSVYIRDTFKNHMYIKIDKNSQVVHLIGELIGIYK